MFRNKVCPWRGFASSVIIICAVLPVQLTSCVSPKSIIYFQGDTLQYRSEKVLHAYVPVIQKSDILSIVIGSLNEESNELFNLPNKFTVVSSNYNTTASGGARMQPLGYLVDSDGNIELPLIGKVRVEGLETQRAADQIRSKLEEYLKEPTVVVRNVNFKVSVLGEVARPGVFVIPDEKISLPEVLSMAGDLTVYGNRKAVILIREENDKREHIRLNLTNRDIFSSPYYYLRKNDIIYIEPVPARVTSTDRVVQLTPLIVSVATALSLIFVRIK